MKTFQPTKAKLAASYEAPGILYALCWDAARKMLYGAGADWAVYRVDLTAKEPKAVSAWTHHTNYVSALAWTKEAVLSAGYDGRVVWTSPDSGEKLREVEAHEGWIRGITLLPDGERFVTVADDMAVKIWSVKDGTELAVLQGHDGKTPQGYATALYAVAAAPDGAHLASGDRTGVVCIWDVERGELVRKLQSPTFYTYDASARVRSIGGVRSLRFSPDGAQLAIGGIGKVTNVDGFVGPARVELWDWTNGKQSHVFQEKHKAVVNDLQFHPTDNWLIGGGGGDSGGLLAFWDPTKKRSLHKVKPKGHLQQLVLDPEGARIFAVGHGGFQVWDCDPPDESDKKQTQEG